MRDLHTGSCRGMTASMRDIYSIWKPHLCVQTLWAIDKDWENDPKTGSRRPAATQYPFDSFMDGYGCTHIREAVSLEELAEGETTQWRAAPASASLLWFCLSNQSSMANAADAQPMPGASSWSTCPAHWVLTAVPSCSAV